MGPGRQRIFALIFSICLRVVILTPDMVLIALDFGKVSRLLPPRGALETFSFRMSCTLMPLDAPVSYCTPQGVFDVTYMLL